MPDLEISRLPLLSGADLQGTDPIAVADISASETKKLTVADLATFGVSFIGNDSISGDQIISLDGGKLLPDSVTAREIAPNAVGSSELADLSVDTAAIQDGAVTNVKLAGGIDGSKILELSIGNAQIIDLDGSKILSGTISTDQLGADCVTAVQLADNSVDTAAVQNGAITNDKLAVNIDGSKILPNSITSLELAPNSVGSSELADASVDTAAIQNGAVTDEKIAPGINGSKLTDGSVADAKISSLDGAKLFANSVGAAQIAPDAIGSSELSDGSVDTAAVQDGAITNVKLASGIDGNKLISGSVSTLQLADDSVTTSKILNGAVSDEKISGLNGSKIFANTVGNTQLASDSVQTDNVVDGAITNDKLAGNIDGSKIVAGSVGNVQLSNNSVQTDNIVDGAVTDSKIANGIDGGKISAASITNVQLGPGSVTNPAIRDGAVTDAKITGPISGTKLEAGSVANTALGAVTDRGLDQSTGKIGITNLVTAGTQSGINWNEQGLITGVNGSIPPSDLPIATDASLGVVSVPATGGLAVTGLGAISIANTIAPDTKQGITYDKHGSIINVSDTLPVASIPIATNSTIGGVKVPGPSITVSVDGALTLIDSGVIAGTYPKVTVNSKGIVTSGMPLSSADLPEINADNITSGELDGLVIKDRSIYQIKLADNSTCYIQESRPSEDPLSTYKGCLWFQESTAQLRLWNGNSWNPVGFGRLSQDNLRWGGIINGTTGQVVTLTDAGQTAQLTVGDVLPPATDTLGGLYMVVDPAGNAIGVTPGTVYDAGDWVLCINQAEGWTRIDTMTGGGGGGGGGSLDQLNDITITDADDGDILVYNESNGQWENQPQPEEKVTSVFGRVGDVVAVNGDYDLGELGDVDLATIPPATGDVLQFDGTEWAPTNLDAAIPVTSVGAGSGLVDSGVGSDVLLDVGAGTGITVNTDDVEINRAVVDTWYVDVSGDTMSGPLILSGDPVTDPQAATKKYVDDVAADAVVSGDAKYVKISGDNMTGNLTLGTDKITLNANGSAKFAGSLSSPNYSSGGATESWQIAAYGMFTATRSANTDPVFRAYQVGSTSSPNALITAAGSAQFAGDVKIGGTLPDAPNITLNADGSGEFASKVGINRTPSSVSWLGIDLPDLANNYGIYVRSEVNTSNNRYAYATGNQGSTGATGLWYTQGDLQIGTNLDGASPNVNIALNADGSAQYAGKVTSASTEDTDGGTTLVTKDYLQAGGSGGTGTFGYWTRTGTDLSPANAGDSASIGNGNITLNADGSGTFEGTITAGKNAPAGDSVCLQNKGAYSALSSQRSSGSFIFGYGVKGAATDKDDYISTNDLTSSAAVAYVQGGERSAELQNGHSFLSTDGANGAVTDAPVDLKKKFHMSGLTGDVYIGPDLKLRGDENILLRADGSIDAAGTVKIGGTLPAAPNITLNADGSASFQGINRAITYIQTADLTGNPTTGKTGTMLQGGTVFATREGTINVWEGRAEGDTQVTSAIDGNGKATFKSDILVGGLPSSPNITLNADGSAEFTGPQVDFGSASGSKIRFTRPIDGAKSCALGFDSRFEAVSDNNKFGLTNSSGGAQFNIGLVESEGSRFSVQTLNSSTSIFEEVASIDNSGAAEFAGAVKIGGTLPAAPNITLNADGSAVATKYIAVRDTGGNKDLALECGSSSVNGAHYVNVVGGGIDNNYGYKLMGQWSLYSNTSTQNELNIAIPNDSLGQPGTVQFTAGTVEKVTINRLGKITALTFDIDALPSLP